MSKMQSIGHCAAWTNRGISSDWRWVGNRKAPLHKMPWGIWVQREAELLSLFQESKIALRSKAHNKCVANWLSSSTAIAWQFPTSGVSDDHPRADPSFPYPKSSPCVATFQRNKRNLSKTKLRPPRSDSCCVLKVKLVSLWKGQAVIRSLLYQPKYSSDQTVPNIFPLAQALSVASRWTQHHLYALNRNALNSRTQIYLCPFIKSHCTANTKCLEPSQPPNSSKCPPMPVSR